MVEAGLLPTGRESLAVVAYLQPGRRLVTGHEKADLSRPAVTDGVGQRLVRQLVERERGIVGQRADRFVHVEDHNAPPLARVWLQVRHVGAQRGG